MAGRILRALTCCGPRLRRRACGPLLEYKSVHCGAVLGAPGIRGSSRRLGIEQQCGLIYFDDTPFMRFIFDHHFERVADAATEQSFPDG